MQRRSPFIMNKVLILVIDGCAPEYITPEFAPNIHRLAKGVCAEYSQVGKAVRFCQNSEGCGTYRYQREPCINFVREISFGNRHGG